MHWSFLLLLSCVGSVVLGEDVPSYGYMIPDSEFINFCLGSDKAQQIMEAQDECQEEVEKAMHQYDSKAVGGFMKFVGERFGVSMCVLQKAGMVTNGEVDKDKVVEFFANQHTMKYIQAAEDRCSMEAEQENFNHFFESWEDKIAEVKEQLAAMMAMDHPTLNDTSIQGDDRRMGFIQRLREKRRRRKQQKEKEEQEQVEEDPLCQMKDMVKHTKVQQDGQEVDLVEEYCKLSVENRESAKRALRPMAYWNCIKETKYLFCANALHLLMRENAGKCMI